MAKVRQHLTVFPKTRLAAAGMGLFAMLLLFRAGDITTTSTDTAYSPHMPVAQVQQVSNMEASGTFSTSAIEMPTTSNITQYHSRTWEPAEDTVRPVTIPQTSGGFSLISY